MRLLLLLFVIVFMVGCNLKSQDAQKQGRNIISSSLTITDSLLIYATWSNEVVVENFITNKRLFVKRVFNNCYAKPVLIQSKLYFPISDSVFTCIDMLSSKTIWNTSLGGRCSEFHLFNNSIIADSKHYGLIGIDANSGKIKFQLLYKYGTGCTIPDLSPYRISFDKEAFYVCDWHCNNISAFRIADGKALWKKNTSSSNSNVQFVDGLLFWGRNDFYKGGQITIISPKDGEILYGEPSKFEENFNPIIYNHKVYYYSYDSKLNELDLEKRKTRVVYVFNPKNDVSGNQMYLLNGHLYYNAQSNIYELDLNSFSNKIIQKDVKDIYGVYQVKSKLEFVL
jgi:outer membrane protein assembly factor BamB